MNVHAYEQLRYNHLSRLRYRSRRFGQWADGARLMGGARLEQPSRLHLGEDVRVGRRAFLSCGPGGTIRIGARSRFGENLFISSAAVVVVEPDVLGSERVTILDTYHEFKDAFVPVIDQPMGAGRPVLIRRGAFLGIGCCIMPGVTVGRNAVVGANAVVTKDVPDFAVVAGVPAQVVKRLGPQPVYA